MTQCPFSRQFAPFDLSDPFPLFAQAREEKPVFYSPEIDYWVVTRHQDIKAIFKDFESFTAENTITPLVPFSAEVVERLEAGGYTPQPVLSNNVPPSHTRIRNVVSKLFTPRRMREFEPAIQQLVIDRIEGFVNRGKVDFVEAFSYELPAFVLFRVLGVPDKDVSQVKKWSDNRILLYYGQPTPEEQAAFTENLIPFWHYTVDLVRQKAAHPQNDLTSDLILMRGGDDAILTLNEIASCMITLLVAGHETTTAQLTNGLQHLLENREKWGEICRHPERIPAAMEELMRYDPSVCTWRRLAKKETTIGGVKIPAGANLLLALNSANRDEAVFDKPEEINFERDNIKEHLAFGFGIHYCVGAPLARLEMKIAFEELTYRLPGLRLAPNQTLNYVPNLSFRGTTTLLVEWDS